MSSVRDIVFKGLKWSTLGTISKALLQFFQISLLARYLESTEFGLVAICLFVVQFSMIFVEFGFASAILNKKYISQGQYSGIFWLNVAVGLILYVIIYFSSEFIAFFFSEIKLVELVPLLSINILINSIGRVHHTLLLKDFQFRAISIIDICASIAGLILALLLVRNDFGVYSLIYSTIFSALISNLGFFLFNIRLNPLIFHFRFSEIADLLKMGGYTAGSSFLDFLSRDLDTLIVGKILGTSELGIYSLAKQIIIKLYYIFNGIAINLLNPLLVTFSENNENLKNYFLKAIKYQTFVNFPIYGLIALCSSEILRFAYGIEYVSGFNIVIFLAGVYGISAILSPVGSLQIATGRTDLGLVWTIFRLSLVVVITSIASIIGDILTVVKWNFILAVFFIYPMYLIQLRKMIPLKLSDYLRTILVQVVVFCLLIICLGSFTQIPVEGLKIELFLKIIIYLISAGSLIFLYDRNFVTSIFSFLRRRDKRIL